MKSGIHPEYVETTVTCTCGSSFTTRSTAKNGVIHADICSSCHPFYTGKQKILDTGGRVARFERRFGKKAAWAASNRRSPARQAARGARSRHRRAASACARGGADGSRHHRDITTTAQEVGSVRAACRPGD